MEVSNVFKKAQANFEKAIRNDLMGLAKHMTKTFEIKNETRSVCEEELFKCMIDFLELSVHECCAITKSNTKCSRRCLPDSKYCRMHLNKSIFDKISNTKLAHPNIPEMYFVPATSKGDAKDTMESIFIEDSFYYVDNSFVYHKDSMDKVGYIETEPTTNKKKYVLTDDPFILQVVQ